MKTIYFPSRYIIEKIKDGDFDKFREIVNQNNYTCVDFSFKGIRTPVMAILIAQAISGTSVESVSLACNYLGPKGAEAFIDALKGSSVTRVNLTRNFIGFDGTMKLIKQAAVSQVKHLILANNRIGPKGLKGDLNRVSRLKVRVDISQNKVWH